MNDVCNYDLDMPCDDSCHKFGDCLTQHIDDGIWKDKLNKHKLNGVDER